jgi:hypothetical protein
MISKPNPDEHNPYYSTYINLIGNEPILELLAQQKDSCYDFFRSIPVTKADFAYTPDKWTIKQAILLTLKFKAKV